MPFLNFSQSVQPRKNFLDLLTKELSKNVYTKQVLLSFTGDPYCVANEKLKLTRATLSKLWLNNVPTAILSKGGARILQDLDLFKKFGKIKVGATLTFDNANDSIKNEPGAAIPNDRLETLKVLHKNGIKTWVSIEPVIDPVQSLNLIKMSLPFVDQYKVGKLNHVKNTTDWHSLLVSAVEILRKNNKQLYIKDDLANYCNSLKLTDNERNHDYLSLTPV